MGKINEVKQELMHRAWAEQIQEYQESGLKMSEWCRSKNINVNTFNSRMKVIRKIALERCPELQSIVPVSVSENIMPEETAENDVVSSAHVEASYDLPAKPEKIIIRKKDIEIELTDNASESTILTLMRGLGLC